MLKPLGNKILVKLLPRYGAAESKLGLTLVDNQKHYQGVRWGEVQAVSDKVYSVKVGDVIVFPGDLGTSFGMTDGRANDGTEWRHLAVSEVLAVEVPEKISLEVAV